MEGGKGTRRSVRRPCAPRQFPAGYVLGAADAAAAGAGELLADVLDELLVLPVLLVEEAELLAALLPLLLESELLAPSFLVEL